MKMRHTIMCSCGKLAIQCKEASKGLQTIVDNGKKEVFNDIEKMAVEGVPTEMDCGRIDCGIWTLEYNMKRANK